ncbi:MAG TPA: tubulin-like doman-containing protein [Candidatus Rifleibacterium sp.]|nr:tubulin-like doman-containing protein [Candidatus Rifleibacterium sp.]HPT47791.1 tubulin-like doman-containing protein [Candidatus Rifleibacterium sp.]
MSTNYENRIALNPALIVGLGGTGKKSLINFKETFLNSPQIKKAYAISGKGAPALPDFIDLLCIDTDIFDASQPEDNAKTGTKLTEGEYHQINIQNAGQITGNLDSETYNYLYEWFPAKLKHHIGQISQGAHQFRFTGRFGIFVDIQKIFQQIKAKMSKIMARSNVNQDDIIVPLTNKQGQILTPEFYVVGSLCGGSGAGMFLDIAYLLKMAYYQLSGGKGKPTIVGIQLTPEAFTQISIDPNVNSTGRLEGNGYASLVETFYYMNKEKFPPTRTAKDIISQDRRNKFMVNYGPIGKSNDATTYGSISEEPPFDQCYLLGTSNQDDIPTYYGIASELIFTKLATQLRQAQNSMLDNASQILGQNSSDLEGKQLKCFSSAGYKSFYYPLDVIRDLYTFKLSMDVTYWLKLSVDRILIDSMVQEFAENNPTKIDLTPEGLFMMTKEIIDRKQFWDNPMFHTLRTVNKQKEGESPSNFILRQIDEMNQNRVKKDEIRAKVRVNFEQSAVKAGEHLLEKVIEIINNPDLGALIAIDFLNAFEKYLTRYPREILARKVQEIKGKLEKEQREYREISTRLKERLSGFAGLGGKLMELGTVLHMTDINDERDKLMKEAKEAVDMEYEMFCISCAEDFLKYLNVQAQSIRKQVEVFSSKLTQISKDGMIERQYEHCLERIKPYSKVQDFIRTYIFEDRDIEPFYKYLLGDLSNNDIEGDFLVKINLRENWEKFTNPEGNSLEKEIVKYCRGIIERRLFGGIEDFIHWKDSVRKGFKKSLVESMMNQSTPLITMNDRGNNSPQRMNIVTLGIFDENSKLSEEIKDALRKGDIGVTVAPTRNPYEISLLQTLHGIAPYNISAITQWHNLYRQNTAKINCHALLTNDAYPVLWSSYGLIPAKKLEEHYMVYLLLRYELIADAAAGKYGIEYNDDLVQYELWYQQDKPQPIGRTITQLFDYLKNNTMGIYLIRSVYNEYWKSLPFPKQREVVSKYLPIMTDKVKKLEEAIEEEIKKNHEVSPASDELLSIKRGILRILQDYNEQFNHILSQRPSGTIEGEITK